MAQANLATPADVAETYLLLPAWWVHAYEANATAKADGGAISRSAAAGVSPALELSELSGLALLLQVLRRQVEKAPFGPAGYVRLEVNLAEHLKQLAFTSPQRRFGFERVIQLLPSLQLLRKVGDVIHCIPLAQLESWRNGSERRDVSLKFTLGRLGAELLLGFSDPYLDLVRLSQGEMPASEILGRHGPIFVPRSVWLDLQGIESVVHLRLERAMQNEFRWLQLEGIFGMSFGELFKDLSFPVSRVSEPQPLLSRQLALLTRLGRKLVEHGVINPTVANQYLAFGNEGSGSLSLAWHASQEHLLEAHGGRALAGAARYFRRRFEEQFKDYVRVLGGGVMGAEIIGHLRGLCEDLGRGPEGEEPAVLGMFEGSMPLFALPLFLELMIRQMPGHGLPLPASVAATVPARLASNDGAGTFGERFAGFLRSFNDGPHLADLFRDMPLACLASPVSRATAEVAAFLKSVQAAPSGTSTRVAGASADTTSLPSPSVRGDYGAGGLPIELQRRPVSPNTRRVAAEELERLRTHDPSAYGEMKKRYMETLDIASRKLILDVQRRMQPDVFDEHLRPRLLRFMVESPSTWRSAESRSKS